MSIELVLVVACALWIVAYVVHRRVGISPNWLVFDGVLAGVTAGIATARDRARRGVLARLVVLPLAVLFGAFRTVHLRYIERKTRAILDGAPGMRRACERRNAPSRRERSTGRDGAD